MEPAPPAAPEVPLTLATASTSVSPASPAPPTLLAASDRVQALIDQVETLYAQGLADYRAGNVGKANEKFNSALALLTGSDQYPKNHRLGAEFERLSGNIRYLALAAIQREDTPSEHQYEPAPLESFGELTFPSDPSVQKRVDEEIKAVQSDLPLVSNEYVVGVIAYLQTRGQGFMRNILKRRGTYQPFISEALRREGLPQDLIYAAAAESAFNPFALSRAGAKGMWQFMLPRGIQYGLKKDRWVDEREDPLKSTVAAARHLRDLYQMFGDWYLALAAYNSGPVTVQRAIEKTGYADFWMLRRLGALPPETQNYVPIVLATALIAKSPPAYGFEVQPDPPLAADEVVVTTPTDLRLVAQLIARPVQELVQFNPSLQRWTTPENVSEYLLRLPPGTRETYEQAVSAIPPENRIWWRAHKVEPQDTLNAIARKFGLSTVKLAEANQLEMDAPLEEGAQLVLPLAPGSDSSLRRVRERTSRRALRYRVRKGDTMDLIATRFDVTPSQIRRWNRLTSSRLVMGRSLKIYVASADLEQPRSSRPRRAAARRIRAKSQTTAQSISRPAAIASRRAKTSTLGAGR